MADPTALRLGDDDAMNGVERTADPVAVWAAAIARSPLAMLIVGGSQRVVRASNYALGNLLGVPGERLDGRRLPEVLPGPVADAAVSIVDRVRHMTRAERGVEVEVSVDGGPTRAWKLAAWPILDLDDRLDGVCVQAADVTAEVAARRKERELGEQVREANDRLLQAGIREQELADLARRHAEEVDRLLHSLTEGVAIVDRKAGVAMMNPVGRSILGIESEDERVPIGAYREIDVQTVDGTTVPFEDWPFNRAFKGERFANEELVVVRPDGSRARIAFHGSGVSGRDGASALGIVVYRDVTELRRLEELRGQYTSLISHDLRAPISAMLGYADLLEREFDGGGAERGREFVGRIRGAAERMRQMLDDLSRSTRNETGALELNRRPTDLRELVAGALEHIATPGHRARIRVETPVEPAVVEVDAERLSHAITNLVTNALKYSPVDTPVQVRMIRHRTAVRIDVVDVGPGIPPDELPRLFRRFYRAGGTKGATGLGLGLYIARLVVEAHGGRIWAESEVGEGSRFCVALPVESASRPDGYGRRWADPS